MHCVVLVFIFYFLLYDALWGWVGANGAQSYAANIYRPWTGYPRTKEVQRASEVPWRRTLAVGNMQDFVFGNVSTLFHAQKNDPQSPWNLLAVYELWSGICLVPKR